MSRSACPNRITVPKWLADVERAWRKHGPKVLDVLAEKYPQAFFGGMVAMTKVIRWETGTDQGGGKRRAVIPKPKAARIAAGKSWQTTMPPPASLAASSGQRHRRETQR
jgi:hypothetical protein